MSELPGARPQFVGGNGRPLFIWHHPPPADLRRGAAIVLCPPVGYEYMSAYPTWRKLAERLAASGFDTLRFDYDGTGNSTGDDEEAGRVDAWLHSIDTVMVEARRLSGSRSVALIGLRAGALLALQAASAGGGVDRLVLWSAFASGHAYVRELAVNAGLCRQEHARDEAGSGFNVAGFMVTPETVATLDQWKPDRIGARPAPEVLLIDHDDRSIDTKVSSRLELLGSRVTRIQPAGTAAMLCQSEFAKVPEQILDAIVNWFNGWPADSPPVAAPVGMTTLSAAHTSQANYRERAVRFGPGSRLFGIVTSPLDDRADAPAIILLNTSVDCHIGPSRLYVPLARQWASAGHSVLRFDLGGLGESVPAAGAAEDEAYPEHALDDVREAIALVRNQSAGRRVILAGLCSGGWIALDAARQGLPVDAIISINPPVYIRDRAAALRWVTEREEIHHYRQSIRDRSKWLKALRGKASYTTFVQVAATTLSRRVASRVSRILDKATPYGLTNDLRRIAARGIWTTFIFSGGDDGLDYFQSRVETARADPKVCKFIRHVVVEGAGHSFRPRAAQSRLCELLMDAASVQAEARPGR